MARHIGRRELLAGALAGRGDAAVLEGLLGVELTAVCAYRHVIALGVLGGDASRLAGQVLGYEREHVRRLSAALAAFGVAPPAGPVGVGQADAVLRRRGASLELAGVRSRGGALEFLYDLESISIGSYYDALGRLLRPALLEVAAQIMGAEAQHAAAIGGLLHPGMVQRAVPVSAVQGKG